MIDSGYLPGDGFVIKYAHLEDSELKLRGQINAGEIFTSSLDGVVSVEGLYIGNSDLEQINFSGSVYRVTSAYGQNLQFNTLASVNLYGGDNRIDLTDVVVEGGSRAGGVQSDQCEIRGAHFILSGQNNVNIDHCQAKNVTFDSTLGSIRARCIFFPDGSQVSGPYFQTGQPCY